MNTHKVMVVRIYITEQSHLLKQVVKFLRETIKVRGCTIFRAVSGFGISGEHESLLETLSLDLPLTIEFFDHAEAVMPALEYLSTLIPPEHIIFWEAASIST